MNAPTVEAPADFLDRLRAILGPPGLIADPGDVAPYVTEGRGLFRGQALAVARPASTAETAAVVAACAESGVAIVPQGGNTGLCGGAVPLPTGRSLVVSLARMSRIRSLDPLDYAMTVEAGCVLANLQRAAAEADRLFPLSLAAEGSCQIGGNLSTNAGGIGVLRYGMARDLVLGLEVVLPDGRVWDGLTALRKDNTGYDLKHLFVGAEGTLGLITAAVLKLFPRPREVETALVAVRDPASGLELLARARAGTGDAVAAFELISRPCIDLVLRHVRGATDPMSRPHPWYVLIEVSSGESGGGLRAALERVLAEAMEAGIATDAVIAASAHQAKALWLLREAAAEAQKPEGASIKHDVSVPVSRVPAFIAAATAACERACPGVRVVAFGHAGDGNVHFNLCQPVAADGRAFTARTPELNAVVHDIVAAMGGSISAEHGIGQLKREELARYESPVALDLMRALKRTLDPKGIMNPGKVL